MKYSKRFNRDYNFYINNLDKFSFCGKKDVSFYPLVIFDDQGVCAKEAFYAYESKGKILKTNEPLLLMALHKCKASINLHITLWSEGREDGTFPRIEWEEYVKEKKLLPWIKKAVEAQMWKIRNFRYGYGFGFKEIIEYEKRLSSLT